MNKKLAHIILVFFDIICLIALWYFFNEMRQLFLDIRNQANMVGCNSKQGFFIFALGVPITHIVIVIEHFKPESIKRHARWINYGFLGFLVLLFFSAFTISAAINVKVENAGYINCEPLEWFGTFSKAYTYTRDQAICDRLVAEKGKEKQAASVARP